MRANDLPIEKTHGEIATSDDAEGDVELHAAIRLNAWISITELTAPMISSAPQLNSAVTPDAQSRRGQCLCGGVEYRVLGPLDGIIVCHCSQCRRTSGHVVAMTSAPAAALRLLRSDTLRWFRSSPAAERGFCHVCGGNLFWRAISGDTVSIAAGTLDVPTGLKLERHIFVRDKSDYYAVIDDLPQSDDWGHSKAGAGNKPLPSL
jgi:hypothetical protein